MEHARERVGLHAHLPRLWNQRDTADVGEVEAEEEAFGLLGGADAAGDVELIAVGAGEGDVGGEDAGLLASPEPKEAYRTRSSDGDLREYLQRNPNRQSRSARSGGDFLGHPVAWQ